MNLMNSYYEGLQIIEFALKNLGIYDYFLDETITEVDINPDNKVFIYIQSKGNIFTGKIVNPEHTRHLMNTLASLENKVINHTNPRISTILPITQQNSKGELEVITETRFEGLVPPVVKNPACAIRKKSAKIIPLDDYVKQGIFSENEKNLMIKYVENRKNILIIGGVNTGKTTLTKSLIELTKNERQYLIDETGELESNGENATFVQILPGIFGPKDALRSALRWSYERLFYGEVRGAEAFDLLNALNSGTSGCISTIHANDCYSGLNKLETYILYEQDTPLSQVIARSVNVLITLKIENNIRFLDSIAEVKDYQNGKYILDFKYQKEVNE